MGAIILLNVSRLSSVALAFAALVSLQTSAGLVYHFAAQSDSQGGYAFSPASALSMAEGINFLIAAWMYRASLLARCGGPTHSYSLPGIPEVAARMGNFVQSLRAQVANELLIQLCGLAVLSAINHYLVFALYQLTDPGTIQLIKFGAAFISPSLLSSFLGRDTSSLQWLLVVLQVAGLISTQYQTGLETHPISTYGLLLLSTAITFLCSYWNECLCKNYSASLKAQTLGLHALGSLINLAVFVFKACMGNEMGFFSGYDSVFAIIVVFLIASISICSRYVNSYADAFVKVIADSITTTILVLLSAILFQAPFTILTVTGSLVVFISNYIYVTYSPMSAPIQRCNERAPLRSKSEDLTAMPGKPHEGLSLQRRLQLGACILLLVFGVLGTSSLTSDSAEWRLPVKLNSVAYCVTGRMRGFPEETVYKSFKENVIDTFSPKSDDHPIVVDTLFIVAMDDDSKYSVNQVGIALDYLKPTEYLAVGNSRLAPPNGCDTTPKRFPPSAPASQAVTFYNQYRKVQECYERIEAREIRQGWRYDWLVRVRPDMLWGTDYPITVHNASRTQISLRRYPPGWKALSDHWAVVPRQMADIYFNAANIYYKCETYEHFLANCPEAPGLSDIDPSDPFNPECYLATWLRIHRAGLVEYNNTFELVNAKGTRYLTNFFTTGRPLS